MATRLPLVLVLVLGVLSSCQAPPPERRLVFDLPLRTTDLSATEAQDDVDTFVYLMRNAYAGFDAHEALSQGALGRSLDALQVSFATRLDPLPPSELSTILASTLVGINDAHLGMTNFRNPLHDRRPQLWASVVEVENWGGALRIVPGQEPPKAGELYEDDPNYLFPSSSTGRFRVGLLSSQSWGSATLRIGGRPQTVALMPSALPGQATEIFRLTRKGATALLRVSSFDPSRAEVRKALDEFARSAEGLRSAQTVILDLRDNGGGSDASWHRFLGSLFDVDPQQFLRRESYRDLQTSATEQASERWNREVRRLEAWQQLLQVWGGRFVLNAETRRQRTWSQQPWLDGRVPRGPQSFRGRLVVVVNRQTASAAESIVPVVRREGGLVVGENTYGAIGFGNVFEYWLPHSGIRLTLAATEFRRPGDGTDYQGDGQGYHPDIWTPTNPDLAQVLADLAGEDPAFF